MQRRFDTARTSARPQQATMIKTCFVLLAIAGLALTLTACTEQDTPDIASVCGENGEDISVEGESLCVYAQAVVIETGFNCPPDRPHMHQGRAVIACSGREALPQERLEQAEQEFLDRRPETPIPDTPNNDEPNNDLCVDGDNDGFCPEDGDCDDTDAAINPSADDNTLDGIDNDCDDSIDEDAPEPPQCREDLQCGEGEVCIEGVCQPAPDDGCNVDADCAQDEVCIEGVCESNSLGCADDADCAENEICAMNVCIDADACTDGDGDGDCLQDGDCDDTNPDVGPSSVEVRDGLDNDCDGQVDEEEGDQACNSDDDCGPGQSCIEGVCSA